MPPAHPISWKKLIRGLRKFGFEGPYSGGRHPYMIKEKIVLTIPNPHKGDIRIELLKRILKQAGISSQDWFSTLN